MSNWNRFAALGLLVFAGACTAGGQDDIDPPSSQQQDGASQDPNGPQFPAPETESLSFNESAVFLTQSTFGPSLDEIESLENASASSWLESQFDQPATLHLPRVLQKLPTATRSDASGNPVPNAKHFAADSFVEAAIMSEDQLRQRMAFALSQILVTSVMGNVSMDSNPHLQAAYYDIFVRNAFGNYRDILEEVTYSPAMATYLTYFRNRKGDPGQGRVPDENYAREIMQLFTIGLQELNMDGTPRLRNGAPIETYTNEDVTGLSRVFTGFSYDTPNFWESPGDNNASLRYAPLKIFPEMHSDLEKSFLGVTIPPGVSGPESVDRALDTLFNHPNVAPFISKQLIQRFITSNPSPDYVERVARVFESGRFTLDNGAVVGAGARGDLKATISAILLDAEARAPESRESSSFGKIREPLIRFTHWARAFNVNSADMSNQLTLRNAQSTTKLSQQILRSPSVFNFYRPGYVAPGTNSGAAGLAAPELQIVSAASIPGYINVMNSYIFNFAIADGGGANTRFQPDYDAELALADNPEELINHLDQLIAGNRLLASTKERMAAVLRAMPVNDATRQKDLEERAQTAVFMTFTAPEYIVQR